MELEKLNLVIKPTLLCNAKCIYCHSLRPSTIISKDLLKCLIEKYGKYILVSRHDLDIADRWFARYGDWAIFFSRLLPVVRTFISFPAGVARMNVPRFIVYTFVGSFPWCLGLAYLGMKLGENWDTLGVYFHKFDIVIGILTAAGAVYYLWRHLGKRKI